VLLVMLCSVPQETKQRVTAQKMEGFSFRKDNTQFILAHVQSNVGQR